MDVNTPPKFNYKPPINRGNGQLLIEPNFSPSEPLDKKLAIARNSEVPKLLRAKGALTEDENKSILYHHVKTDEVCFLGTPENNRTLAGYLDPKSFHKRSPRAYAAAVEAQKMALKRDEKRPTESKLELILGGGHQRSPRTYQLGFTVNPQVTATGSAPVNKVMLEPENRAYVIKFLQLITEALMGSVETIVSQEELDLLAMQREIDVPFTFGSTTNYLFTTLQLNYSDFGVEALEETLGLVGGLHADVNDSPNHWTSLLSLSNIIPVTCTGGRTLMTSTRLYVEFPQQGKGASVFRAVHPHISIGPERTDQDREPCHFEMPEGNEELDPDTYISARCMAVGYAKDTIMTRSPEIQRVLTPLLYKQEPNTKTNHPESLPDALLAFGTRENQANWHAMSYAKNHARDLRNGSVFVPLTAEEIAHNFRYIADDKSVATPDVNRIRITLLGNSANAKNDLHSRKWAASDKLNREIISQRWFPVPPKKGAGGPTRYVSKGGPTKWVEVSEIGSTFKELELDLAENPTAQSGAKPKGEGNVQKDIEEADRERLGKRPYECAHCSSRYATIKLCKKHHKDKHGDDYEWQRVEPSRDPKFPPSSPSAEEDESEDVEMVDSDADDEDMEDKADENVEDLEPMDDEESDEEPISATRKRKRRE